MVLILVALLVGLRVVERVAEMDEMRVVDLVVVRAVVRVGMTVLMKAERLVVC